MKKYLTHALVLLSTGALLSCGPEEMNDEVEFNVVQAFLLSPEGEMLLGTDRGLVQFDRDEQSYQWYGDEASRESVQDLALESRNGKHHAWMAGERGAQRLDASLSYRTENSGLSTDELNCLHFSPTKVEDYFAGDQGLDILSGAWTHYEGFQGLYGKHAISDVATTSKGHAYVCTRGGGVERFTLGVDGISGATVFDRDWSGLATNEVNCVYVDDTVQAYGTNQGFAIHYSEFTKWNWLSMDSSFGLSNDTVLSVCRDANGLWWFGTMQGLNSLDEESYELKTYTELDELPPYPIKFLAVDPQGILWLASDMGLTSFSGGQFTHYPL